MTLKKIKPYEVPGFFPTSPRVAQQMIQLANISPGSTILEPSAGDGALLNLMPDKSLVTCYEINPKLKEYLIYLGYTPQGNFLESVPGLLFDVAIMNPPFEDEQYIEHINHALNHVRVGGTLVSLVPATDTYFLPYLAWRVYDVKPGSGDKEGSVEVKIIVI